MARIQDRSEWIPITMAEEGQTEKNGIGHESTYEAKPELSFEESWISEIVQTNLNIIKAKDLAHLRRVHLQIKEYLQGFKGIVRNLIEKIGSCIIEITTIAEDLDKFHRGATIVSVTGSSFGIAGGITTIVGLALAPVTLGASLIVSGVGIGVAVAGGVTGASASIADAVNIKKKSNKVQELVNEINEMMKGLKEISDNISLEVENIQGIFNEDKFINLTRVLGRGALSAVEASRVIQLSKISTVASRGAQLATRGVQAAAAISGVLAAVFIIIDAIFIVKGAIDLHKGSKTEEAARIRACAEELQIISLDLQDVEDKCSKELSFIFKY